MTIARHQQCYRGAVSADVAYLNRYRLARDSSRAQMDHALSVQLTINLSAGR